MEKFVFSKMQGLGNNYIYMDYTNDLPENPQELAQKVSNVNTGIGSDGLILIEESNTHDFRMRMFNADGGEAEMCGNGVRCIAKYVYEKGLTNKKQISLDTQSGTILLDLVTDKDNLISEVAVDMGEPIFTPADIPVKLDAERILNYPYQFEGQEFKINCIGMGNPHIIIFVPEITDDLVLELGPKIEKHEIFPNRVNVEFVKVINPEHLEMRVWERGSGETQACGTGACAVLVAAVLNDLSKRKARVSLLGGDLEINWKEDNHVIKTGPAEFICEGTYYGK